MSLIGQIFANHGFNVYIFLGKVVSLEEYGNTA